MTDRIYYRDSYQMEFSAHVLTRSADGRRVQLDRTAFYPTSGGQQFDIGLLNEVRVIDVIDEGTRVVHLLADALTSDDVSGKVDWTRRFDHMQQHTGQHVVSAVFEDLFGFRTASVHFGDESASIDLETPALSYDQILRTEERANAIVFDNRAVGISFEKAATAQGLRKAAPRDGELRIITVAGVDRSACGGTHVRATGEIGPILLRRQDRMHGNVRIEFLCGTRALRSARSDYEMLTRSSAALGVAPVALPDRVVALSTELQDAQRLRKKLSEDLAGFRARDRHAGTQPDAGGVRWIVERIDSGSLDDLRALAHATTALQGVAFIGVVQNPAQILFAASEDTGIDAGKLLKAELSTVGGRGGGSARVAQGSAPAEKLEGIVEKLQQDKR